MASNPENPEHEDIDLGQQFDALLADIESAAPGTVPPAGAIPPSIIDDPKGLLEGKIPIAADVMVSDEGEKAQTSALSTMSEDEAASQEAEPEEPAAVLDDSPAADPQATVEQASEAAQSLDNQLDSLLAELNLGDDALSDEPGSQAVAATDVPQDAPDAGAAAGPVTDQAQTDAPDILESQLDALLNATAATDDDPTASLSDDPSDEPSDRGPATIEPTPAVDAPPDEMLGEAKEITEADIAALVVPPVPTSETERAGQTPDEPQATTETDEPKSDEAAESPDAPVESQAAVETEAKPAAAEPESPTAEASPEDEDQTAPDDDGIAEEQQPDAPPAETVDVSQAVEALIEQTRGVDPMQDIQSQPVPVAGATRTTPGEQAATQPDEEPEAHTSDEPDVASVAEPVAAEASGTGTEAAVAEAAEPPLQPEAGETQTPEPVATTTEASELESEPEPEPEAAAAEPIAEAATEQAPSPEPVAAAAPEADASSEADAGDEAAEDGDDEDENSVVSTEAAELAAIDEALAAQADEAVAGEFETVEDVLANAEQLDAEELAAAEQSVHEPVAASASQEPTSGAGATADDVAKELDEQPEAAPAVASDVAATEDAAQPQAAVVAARSSHAAPAGDAKSRGKRFTIELRFDPQALLEKAKQAGRAAWPMLQRSGPYVHRACERINAPLSRLSKEWRDGIGWLAVMHLFIGLVWVLYAVFFA